MGYSSIKSQINTERNPMTIKARHILVKEKFEIEDIQKKVKEGESFEKLAQDFSTCPSGKSGGDLGAFSRGDMVENFDKAAFALKVGEVSEIVPTQFGFHLIQRYE